MEAQAAMTEVVPQPKKYLFDLVFDENGLCLNDERDKVTYSQEQLDAAKKEAHEAGLAAGRKTADDERSRARDALLAEIDKKLAGLVRESSQEWLRQLAQMRQTALIITRKIIPSYVERHGTDEIEALVRRVMGEMSREPRLVIRVAEKQFEDIKKMADALTVQQAFAGNVVLLGDPALEVSDCRVEWANGGVERDMRTLWQDIERVLGEVPTFESADEPEPPQAEAKIETKEQAPEPPEAEAQEPSVPPPEESKAEAKAEEAAPETETAATKPEETHDPQTGEQT